MPDYLSIVAVDPPFESLPAAMREALPRYPDRDDDTQTSRVLAEDLARIGKAAPDLEVVVFYRSPSDWVSLGVMRLARGIVHDELLVLSAAPDSCEPAPPCAPDIAIALDIDAEQLIDAIAPHVSDEVEADANEITLPFHYEHVDDAKAALGVVAAHLADPTASVLVDCDGEFFAAELVRGAKVSLRPCFVWHADAALRRRARQAFGQRTTSVVSAAAERTEPITASNPTQPLVTGPAARRIEALAGLMPHRGTPPPELFAGLLAAVRDPANADARFEGVRRELYEELARFPDATKVLIDALEREHAAEPRLAIVGELAKRSGSAVAEALVAAYRRHAELREAMGERIWRSDETVELLVRRELVVAWGSDRAYAKSIVAMLDAEAIRVPAEWIEGADASLRRALRL